MGGKHIFKSKSEPGKQRQHIQRSRSINSNTNKVTKVKQQQQVKEAKNQLKENLSFCGCGFLGIYHVGVASCFHEYAPQLSMHKIAGSSAGAIVAVAHMCGNLQLAYLTTGFLRVAIDARSRSLGPFHPSFDINAILRDALQRGLPDDVHIRASGRLHISLTRVYDGENVIVSKFDTKEDVIQALLCSCFIPFWSGLTAPKYKGVTYIDGGFSNNLLMLDDKTVTVSPFAGEADICPQDDVLSPFTVNLSNTSFSMTPNNLYRLSHALIPPAPEVLSDLCEQGFADGIRFLQRMKLISCTKCLEIRSSSVVTHETEIIEQTIAYRRQRSKSTISFDEQQLSSGSNSLNEEYGDPLDEELDCDGCILRSRNALRDPLPKQVADKFREACDSVNKSLSNWFYSHRPIKYLSYLAAPYYLPMNISLALFMKYWQQLPTIGIEIVKCIYDLKDLFIEIVKRAHERSTTSILTSPSSFWRDEEQIIKEQQQSNKSAESSISVKIRADCRHTSMTSLTTYECCLTICLFGRDISTSINKCM